MSINIWNHPWQNSAVAHGGLCVIYWEHVTSNFFSVFTEVVKKQGRNPRVRICTFLNSLIIKQLTLKAGSTTHTHTHTHVGPHGEHVSIFKFKIKLFFLKKKKDIVVKNKKQDRSEWIHVSLVTKETHIVGLFNC